MSRLRIVIMAASVLLVAGCSSHSKSPSAGPTTGPSAVVTTPAQSPSPSSASPSASVSSSPATAPSTSAAAPGGKPTTLPIGKLDLPLGAGVWRSPVGFAPTLRFTVPAGWSSVHRGQDGFDIGQTDPSGQPKVAIVFLTPKTRTAAEAMTAVTTAANGNVEPTTGEIGDQHADTVDITGGSGQLIASRSNGIALDAADGQQARLFALTAGGAPLIVVVLVPQSGQFDAVWPAVQSVLASVRFG